MHGWARPGKWGDLIGRAFLPTGEDDPRFSMERTCALRHQTSEGCIGLRPFRMTITLHDSTGRYPLTEHACLLRPVYPDHHPVPVPSSARGVQ
jgi:hypothetical protein